MFRAEDPQGKLFGGYARLVDWVGEDGFYAWLGRERATLFPDELFRSFYSDKTGRNCIPPSVVAMATFLQIRTNSSDRETIAKCMYDDRWKVALNLDDRERPLSRATLVAFRTRLHVNEGFRTLFLRQSLTVAVRSGLLKTGDTEEKLQALLDTTPILGRGAVKDTYNLVGDGIMALCRALSKATGEALDALVARLDLSRYFNETVSLKGGAEIDWTNDQERRVFLNSLVADAQRVLLESRRVRKTVDEEQQKAIAEAEDNLGELVPDNGAAPPTPDKTRRSAAQEPKSATPTCTAEENSDNSVSQGVAPDHSMPAQIREGGAGEQKAVLTEAQDLLEKLLTQDLEPDPSRPGKIRIKEGTAKDRIPSVHDSEMRHGRKSASKRFDGHKLAVAVAPLSKMPGRSLVTALDVLPGNAPDSQNALKLVEETEANTGMAVGKSIGDCAYGDGATRQEFADAGRALTTKVPAPPSNNPYHKALFDVDLDGDQVTCPAGHTTAEYKWVTSDSNSDQKVKRFSFPVAVCQACPNRSQCVHSKDDSRGRTVTLHPQERLLQQARQSQTQPETRQDLKTRQHVEHALARFMQFGARQARYVGRAKTKVHLGIIAAVINILIIFSYTQRKQEQVAVAAGAPPPETTQPHWPPHDRCDPTTTPSTTGISTCPRPGDQAPSNGIRGAPILTRHADRGAP